MPDPTPRPNEAARIVDELHRSIEGDPWHGDAAAMILRDVTFATAAKQPPGDVHSIWGIVRHMTAWTEEVGRRLDGLPARELEAGDWPSPTGFTEGDWRRDVAALVHAHHRVLEKVRPLSDRYLHASPEEPRDRAAGSGVSRYVLLHGLAQHHAYHAGQIAVLKKILAAR
jgi:hypothetical protein